LIFIIFGAIGGFFRTYISHEARIIWPSIGKRGMKLGFLISVAIGAIIAYLATIGMVAFIPSEVPQSLWNTIMLGFVIGLMSQTLLEKIVGIRLRDPDEIVIGGAGFVPFGTNLTKNKMYEYVHKNIPNVERILIVDGDVGGTLRVMIVPKKGTDPDNVRMQVENAINRLKCPGIQVYTKLPEEKVIDLRMFIEILDGTNPEKTRSIHTKNITKIVSEYINSLPPGEAVLKSKIIALVVSSSPLIKDLRGDKLIATPPFEGGRITIKRFEVARAGNIEIEVLVRQIE